MTKLDHLFLGLLPCHPRLLGQRYASRRERAHLFLELFYLSIQKLLPFLFVGQIRVMWSL